MLTVLSAGLAGLLGLGWLIGGPVLHGSLWPKNRLIPLLPQIPLLLIWGLILNYGLVLSLQSLKTSLMFSDLLAVCGLGCFAAFSFHQTFRVSKTLKVLPGKIYLEGYKWLGIALVCLLYVAPIVAQPLLTWDARSIWFFHAKMIYVAGSFSQATGWTHPSAAWSHVHYPNLVPVLAAQVAYLKGFWNEYLPKAALIFVLVPAVLWLFTFARRSMSFALLLMLLPFSLGELQMPS